jgi:chromosome segregation ATPase
MEQHTMIAAQLAAEKKLLETRVKSLESASVSSKPASPVSSGSSQLQEQLSLSHKQLEELRAALSVAQRQLDTERQTIVSLRSDRDAAILTLEGVEKTLVSLREEIAECRETAKEAEKSLQAQLEALSHEHAQSAGGVFEKLVDTQAKLSETRRQHAELQSRSLDLSAQLAASQKQAADLTDAQKRSVELAAQLSVSQKESADLRAQLDAATSVSQTRIVDLQAHLATETQTRRALQEKIEETLSQMGALRLENALLHDQLSAAQTPSGLSSQPTQVIDPQLLSLLEEMEKGNKALEAQLVAFEQSQQVRSPSSSVFLYLINFLLAGVGGSRRTRTRSRTVSV